jgi:hypothetical protein
LMSLLEELAPVRYFSMTSMRELSPTDVRLANCFRFLQKAP